MSPCGLVRQMSCRTAARQSGNWCLGSLKGLDRKLRQPDRMTPLLKYPCDGTLFRHADQVNPTSSDDEDGIFRSALLLCGIFRICIQIRAQFSILLIRLTGPTKPKELNYLLRNSAKINITIKMWKLWEIPKKIENPPKLQGNTPSMALLISLIMLISIFLCNK